MYTTGNSTLSVTVTRFSVAIAGVFTSSFGTFGPDGSGPKYFSTSARAFALSMSPTIARLALFGA